MENFFIDPYKKYYDKLSADTALSTNGNQMKEKSTHLVSTVSRLSSKVNSSLWKELGYDELVNTTLPTLSLLVSTLNDCITSGLVVATDLAINTLLPDLTKLKETDELYTKTNDELKALVVPPKTKTVKEHWYSINTIEVENEEYTKYLSTKQELEANLKKYETTCNDFINKIDETIKKINELNSIVNTKVKESVSSTTGVRNHNGKKEYGISSSMEVSRTDTLINYGEYYVVNTNYSVIDYYNHIQDKKIYQASDSRYYNSCSSVAHLHAKELTYGKSGNNLHNLLEKGGIDSCYHKNNFFSENKQVVLNEIYNELSQGRPVTLNCANNNGGRHWVTVIGFKTEVESGSALKAEDLLILDAWDGEIERMDCEDSRVMASGRTTGQNYDWRIDKMNEDRLASIPTQNA